MDVKIHKKAYDEGRKASPKSFNPDFNKHMNKVVKRDESMRKVAYEDRKIKQ